MIEREVSVCAAEREPYMLRGTSARRDLPKGSSGAALCQAIGVNAATPAVRNAGSAIPMRMRRGPSLAAGSIRHRPSFRSDAGLSPGFPPR
jgi:hypothetical protein